jgi:hypothetical protein
MDPSPALKTDRDRKLVICRAYILGKGWKGVRNVSHEALPLSECSKLSSQLFTQTQAQVRPGHRTGHALSVQWEEGFWTACWSPCCPLPASHT